MNSEIGDLNIVLQNWSYCSSRKSSPASPFEAKRDELAWNKLVIFVFIKILLCKLSEIINSLTKDDAGGAAIREIRDEGLKTKDSYMKKRKTCGVRSSSRLNCNREGEEEWWVTKTRMSAWRGKRRQKVKAWELRLGKPLISKSMSVSDFVEFEKRKNKETFIVNLLYWAKCFTNVE